jgi:hypothetical protein
MVTIRILAAGLSAAVLAVSLSGTAALAQSRQKPAPQQAAQAAPAPKPSLGLASLDGNLDTYIGKSNGVVGLLNTSLRAADSWQRYLSWVNVKAGPTGRERIIYGLYSVSDSSAKDAIAKARKSASAEPAIPALDGATKEMADAFETLVPILNEAEAYYDRKDYLGDKMAGGKELHGKLVPAALAFLAAREKVNALQDEFKEMLDVAQLDRIEKAEGKSVRWHGRRTLALAKKAVDLMPNNPRGTGTDMKAFDAALAAYGEAVRDFDKAVRESGKSGALDSQPRDILGKLREMRDAIGRGRMDGMRFSFDHRNIISSYNMMVSMSNSFFR